MNDKNKKDPKKKVQKTKKKRSYWGLVTLLWLGFVLLFVGIAGIFWGASQGLLGSMPNVRDLEDPDINVASEIYSSDGKLIGKFETEKRIPLNFEDLPANLVDALLAKEDIRFDDHSGIDPRAVGRAFKGMFTKENQGGGSTLTQQLAKQLFTKKPAPNIFNRIQQKIKEWVTSVNLERRYTKEEIIAMYFNKFDFLYGAHGVQMAAKVYFNKEVKDLNVEESAMLVALFESPWGNNPFRNKERAMERRNRVIEQMAKYQKITPTERDSLVLLPVKTDRQYVGNVFEDFSGYYKHALKKDLLQYFDEYEEEYGKKYNLYRDGLKIYVTLDSRMQEMGEAAVAKHLTRLQRVFSGERRYWKKAPFRRISMEKRERIFRAAMRRTIMYKNRKRDGMTEEKIVEVFNQKRDSVQYFSWKGKFYKKDVSWMDSIIYHKHILQAGLMSMDPKDGTIKAWVGGIDWDFFKYDHVKQAKRQVGSTFKPIVYASAINQLGYTPCHTILNTTFNVRGWKVIGGGGSLSLRDGLAYSKNPVAARLISATGTEPVRQLAKDMGVYNTIRDNDFTIALGSSDLTVYEMVGALSTLANGGIYVKPELILRVEDDSGKVIKSYEPETKEVLHEDVAYTMIDVMKGTTTYGTAKSMRGKYGIRSQVAGKTGTTNDNSDGWFIGLTPNLATGVWVGAEDRFASFQSNFYGQGAVMAMPIWAYYMKSVYSKGKEFGVRVDDKFEKPEGIDERWDCGSRTGFNSYGDVGKIYDSSSGGGAVTTEVTVEKVTVEAKGSVQSVNTQANSEDDIEDDF